MASKRSYVQWKKRYYDRVYKKKTNTVYRQHALDKLLPYDEAEEIVRAENIPSKKAYFIWHRMHGIKNIPRRPEVCPYYKNDWVSWNKFLGNNNKFGEHKHFIPYNECLWYAHNCPATTQKEWLEMDHPEGVPRHPQYTYRGYFTGWNSFLGTGNKKASNIVQLEKAKQTIPHILIIGKHLQSPHNEYIISVVQGEAKSREYIKENNIIVQKAYYLDEGYNWRDVVNRFCSDMGDGCYVCNNINELLFQIPLLWCQL